MGKFIEAQNRLFKNKYACKDCKAVVKAPTLKVIAGKIRCRNCGSTALRPLRKK
ncbi:MAG: hypothetical protein ACMXYK_00630 [Candidatus Woesearchaeota archaeon]